MEILTKLIDFINKLINSFKEKKVEKEEIQKVQVQQNLHTKKVLENVVPREIKPPKKEDFFNDEDW